MAAHAPDQLRTLSVAQQAEEEGWEGLNFTAFGVFPSIKLDQGFFKTSDGESLGEQFKCICGVGKRRWLYRTDISDRDPRYEIAYSTDNATQSMSGTPLTDLVAKWRAAGMGYQSQIYYDIPATLEDGRMMLLQVPPASQGNMTNMVATRIMHRLPAHETWVLIGKGPTVIGGKSKKDFTPVTFTILK